MSKDTGGYAFPIPNADFQTFEPKTVDEYRRIQSGMTLRDYFAAKAAQGLMSDVSQIRMREGKSMAMEVAEMSYILADAMIAFRGQ